MKPKPTPQEALVYAMVTMSAVDRIVSDGELSKIGAIVAQLPVFKGFDINHLVKTAEKCGDILSEEDGLDTILESSPEPCRKSCMRPPMRWRSKWRRSTGSWRMRKSGFWS